MKKCTIRRSLAGVAYAALVAIGATAISTPASAETMCTETVPKSGSFECSDPDQVTSGTFTPGATLHPWHGLYITNDSDLNVQVSDGVIATVGDWDRAIYLDATGAVTFNFRGSATTEGLDWNTIIVGGSVTAETGTILASGSIVAGLGTKATNGDNSTTAGSTTVLGTGFGIAASATNGNVLLNTGTIYAPSLGAQGVYAQTIAGGSCGTAAVNVTGNIFSGGMAVHTRSCGTVSIDVQAGATISRASNGWTSIYSEDATDTTITIAGVVESLSAHDDAIWIGGGSSITTVASSGHLKGTVWTGDQADILSIAPGGIWQTSGLSYFGDGVDSIDNAGTITVFEAGANISGLESMTNRGSIELADGNVGGVFSVSGDYVGISGSSVHLDATEFDADRVVIGGNASGITSLFVNTTVLIPDPVLVVDTLSSQAGAFVLGKTSATPLIDLNLTQIGADYFLTAVPSETALSTLKVGMAARGLWYQSTQAILSQSSPSKRRPRTPLQLWAQGSGIPMSNIAMISQNNQAVDRSANQYRGIQAGIDYHLNDRSVLGLTMGYMPSTVRSSATSLGVNTSNSNLGIYAQYGGATGPHAGVVAKFERNEMRLTNAAFSAVHGSPDTSTAGIEAEAGMRKGLWGGSVDVVGGVAYVRNHVRGFASDGLAFNLDSGTSVRARLGARFEPRTNNYLFASATLFHEFAGDENLRLSSAVGDTNARLSGAATSARFEVGFGGSSRSPASFSSWLETGSLKALGFNFGLRL